MAASPANMNARVSVRGREVAHSLRAMSAPVNIYQGLVLQTQVLVARVVFWSSEAPQAAVPVRPIELQDGANRTTERSGRGSPESIRT